MNKISYLILVLSQALILSSAFSKTIQNEIINSNCQKELIITLTTEARPNITEGKGSKPLGGIVGEIVTKAFRAKNIKYNIVWRPYRRAQKLVLKNPDKKTFMIPQRNVKVFNNNFVWVEKLYSGGTVFINHKRKKKINNLKEASKIKVGLAQESSYKSLLKNSFIEYEVTSMDSFNLHKLKAKKIDAWYTTIVKGLSFLRDEPQAKKKFHFGSIIQEVDYFIVTSKSTPKEIVKRVKNAISDFKTTAEYKKILKRYLEI